MSQLHVNQISTKIKELFADKIDFSDINANGKERENQILTRCLAAYAIFTSSDCSIDEAALSVTDGYNDNGIDAILYSSTLKMIFIVQSKWINNGKGAPDASSIRTFCGGIKDLSNYRFERFNEKINAKSQFITENTYGVKWCIILADTGDEKFLGKHAIRVFDDLMNEFNDLDDETSEIMSYKRINQHEIYNSMNSIIDTSSIMLELALDEPGNIKEPYAAYYGCVSGSIIYHWWSKHKRRLFDKNIRQVLGSTDVNEEIRSTIINNPEQFWYFNNGITIIADKIEKAVVGTFKLEGAYIVNGAQTVSTIGKCGESGINLEKVKVLTRVISLKDAQEGFGDLVTKSNNRQNRIENRDFVSQDEQQKRIRIELAHANINYHITRSNELETTDNSIDLIEATVALACAHKDVGLSVQAKRGIGKYYEDLDKGIYRSIFNSSTTGVYVLNCVQLDRLINEELRAEINKLARKSGRKYGLLVHGNRMITHLLMTDLLFKDATDTISDYDKQNVKDRVLKVIDSLFDIQEKYFSDNLLGTLYKNKTKCIEIKTYYLNN